MDALTKARLAVFMVNKAACDYKISRLAVSLRFWQAHRRRFSPTEMAEYDLLNIADPNIQLRNYVSNEELLSFQSKLNPRSHTPCTEDKYLFAKHCQKMHIPTTTLVSCIDLTAAEESENLDEVFRVVEGLSPGQYVIKPVAGCHGAGVRFVEHDGTCGSGVTARLIYEHCAEHPAFRRWLIEERLFNHPDVLSLSPSTALQTVRVVTFVCPDQSLTILAARWRLASANAMVDNFCHGTSSGLLCILNPRSGVIDAIYKGKRYPYEFALTTTDRHLETGQLLTGKQIPLWSDVVPLVERAARAFLPLRSIGWDVALTPRGPLIVEGNCFWDAHNEAGLMRSRLEWMQERL